MNMGQMMTPVVTKVHHDQQSVEHADSGHGTILHGQADDGQVLRTSGFMSNKVAVLLFQKITKKNPASCGKRGFEFVATPGELGARGLAGFNSSPFNSSKGVWKDLKPAARAAMDSFARLTQAG